MSLTLKMAQMLTMQQIAAMASAAVASYQSNPNQRTEDEMVTVSGIMIAKKLILKFGFEQAVKKYNEIDKVHDLVSYKDNHN